MAFPASNFDFDTGTLRQLRQAMLKAIFGSNTARVGNEDGGIRDQLAQIAQVLERSATNEPTVYDNGLVRSSTGSSTNLLTQQVERALTQVLGRAPGREPTSFVKALNAAFPMASDGQVMNTPARSVVSLYSPVGNGDRPLVPGSSLTGQLSVAQANLYRQASIIAADALRVLEGLKPFEPTADLDAVDALTELIRTQINILVEEFGRVDEPRKERVQAYLNTLRKSLDELGVKGRFTYSRRLVLKQNSPTTEPGQNIDPKQFRITDFADPVTIDDEALIAGYELLNNYVNTLDTIWNNYQPIYGSATTNDKAGRYSKNLSRASILLPVIADSNANFMSAMDSIGFTESERRSDAALFNTLKDNVDLGLLTNTETDTKWQNIPLPNITVNDFNDWVDRFTTIEAPSILATSGKFGLNFVTDQADTLFWVISIVLYALKTNNNDLASPLLEKILSYERVKQTLTELVFQLNTLADLASSTN